MSDSHSPRFFYNSFLEKNLHQEDCEYILDKIEENQLDVVQTMHCYESGLRMCMYAYGKGSQYKELVELCNAVLIELVTGSPQLNVFYVYLDFCINHTPMKPAIDSLLDNFKDDIEPWIRGIDYYLNTNSVHKILLLKSKAVFKTEIFKIDVATFKTSLKLCVKTKTHDSSNMLNFYSDIVKHPHATVNFLADLLVYLGEIKYPVSSLICKIYFDIMKKFPYNELAKVAKLCHELESQILRQRVTVAAAEETRDSFLSFLLDQKKEDIEPVFFELYFYFIDRVHSTPAARVNWFRGFAKCTFQNCSNWWIGLITTKQTVPIEVLAHVIRFVTTTEEKKKIMPLIQYLLKEMIARQHDDASFRDIFRSIFQTYYEEDDYDLSKFSFDCFKQVYDYAQEGTQLKKCLEREVTNARKQLLLAKTYREQGIVAARKEFEGMRLEPLVVEYMLQLEEAQTKMERDRIRTLYLDLTVRTKNTLDEQARNMLAVLLKWAEFEENYGAIEDVVILAQQVLYGDHWRAFYEMWSRTRLYSHPEVSQIF